MPDGVQRERRSTCADRREVCNVDNSQAGSTRISLCIKTTAMGALTPDTAASFVSRKPVRVRCAALDPHPARAASPAGATLMLAQPPGVHDHCSGPQRRRFHAAGPHAQADRAGQRASDVAIRMAPFLTAGLVAMQTMERGNITRPDAADADDRRRTRRCRRGRCGRGGVPWRPSSPTGSSGTRSTPAKVATMIADIGGLFTDLGSLFKQDEWPWGDDGPDDGLHHAA